MYEVWYHDWKEEFMYEDGFESREQAEAWIEQLEEHEMWDYAEAWYSVVGPEDEEDE